MPYFEEYPRAFCALIHEDIPHVYHTYFYILKTYRNEDIKGSPVSNQRENIL